MGLPIPLIPLANAALFLDFDGTLAPIVDSPASVKPSPGTIGLLQRLGSALDGRVAIVSGRPIHDIDRLISGVTSCVSGVHGLERRTPGGAVQTVAPHPAVPDAQAVLEALARARPGLILEPKGASVALHYRQAPGAEDAVLEAAGRLAEATGLRLQAGSMVVELRTPGPDKGEAVNAFMREAPFKRAVPIFIGDDLTDEPAFEAASALGGFAILVGERRPSFAQYHLADPGAVICWLELALDRRAFSPAGLNA